MKVLTTVAISAPTTPPINPSSSPIAPPVVAFRLASHCARGRWAHSSKAVRRRRGPAHARRAALLYYYEDIKKSAAMRQVRTLGLLGTGVIGGGWAARALHFGIDVVAADAKPQMEEGLRGAVANAEGALARLSFAPLPAKGRLTFTTDLHAMARQADFIQENIPEQLELKQRVLADVSRHAGADVVIASSTSGLMPSDLQRGMVGPERFLVAHPFNPVYLLPLVELVGGRQTSTAALDAAGAFFTYIGMHA